MLYIYCIELCVNFPKTWLLPLKIHLIQPYINLPNSFLCFSYSNVCNFDCFPMVENFPTAFYLIRALHVWLPVFVFLKNYIVFISEWYFQRELNSRSALQRYLRIVCCLLLSHLGSLWRQYALLLPFPFLAAFTIFLFVFVFGCFSVIFTLLLFSPLWYSFNDFLVACLIILAWDLEIMYETQEKNWKI